MLKVLRNKKKYYPVFCFLIVLLLHEIVNIFMYSPWAMGDELGVLASGAGCAGLDWSNVFTDYTEAIIEVNYYGGGLGILLTPLFVFFSDRPFLLYQSVLFLMAIIQSVSSVLSYKILHNELKIKNQLFVFLMSIASSFFVTSRATNAMNENALILCTWSVFYILTVLLRNNIETRCKKIYSILLGIIISYSYTVHTRAIILIFSTLFILLFIVIVMKKFVVSKLYFSLSFLFSFCGAYIFNETVKEYIFKVSKVNVIYNTGSMAAKSVFEQLFDFIKNGHWQAFGDIFLTNILGILIITGSLFGILFFAWIRMGGVMVRGILKRRSWNIDELEKNKFLILALFVFLCTWLMICLYTIQGLGNTILALSQNQCTRSHFYLRYPGAFMSPLIVLIGIAAWKQWIRKIDIFLTGVLFLICSSYTIWSIIPRIGNEGDKQFDYYHYFSPFSFTTYDELITKLGFKLVVFIGVIFLAIFTYEIIRNRRILIAITVPALFLYQYFYLGIMYDIPNSRELHFNAISSITLFQENQKLRDVVEKVYVPLISGRWEMPYVVQFYLPEEKIIRAMPDKEEEAVILTFSTLGEDVIINNYEWCQLEDGTFLYVKGDRYIRQFEESGVEFYSNE